ncbi:MAG: FG-GAP repeat protein, partial [Thermoplasmata archaeon]|nr:FG-GAP repeat protein [Thermoplasmata archaeon]
NDGYDDVIVGAPYVSGGDSRILIDDNDIEYSDIGNWLDNSLTTAYKGDYRYEDDIPNNGDSATWIPMIDWEGFYEVFVWWPNPPGDRATDAPYTINFKSGGEFFLPAIAGYVTGIGDGDGSDGDIIINVTQNTTTYSGQWNSLGVYEFVSGNVGNVTLTDVANDRVVADAVKFVRCTEEGAAYIFFGNASIDTPLNTTDANITMYGNETGGKFGFSVSGAGDVNNDGLDDVLVGAPGANKAVVILNYGQNNPLNRMLQDDFEDGILADWYEEGDENGAATVGNIGGAINGSFHLTSADDTDAISPIVDATGYYNLTLSYKRRMRDGNWSGDEDLLVMIRVDGGSWASVTSEEAHGDTQTPDLVENRQVDLSPYKANNSRIEIQFDLNDGGFMDINQEWDFDDVRITGTPYFANVILEGGNSSDQFGFSVSGAEDVDCDGFDDIIVGAPQNNSGTGAAYIFEGVFITIENSGDGLINLSVGDTANVTFTGESSSDLFGYSVSSASNLTGDGFSDVIVGAPNVNGNGAVYVFYGSSSMGMSIPAGIADYIEFGESGMDYFGWSVSGAGDVIRADGYDEILAGAPFHDPLIKTDAGKAYLLRTVSRPVIRDNSALPNIQISGGNVNITCNATAPDGIQEVWVNITLPGGGYINNSMIQGSGDEWYHNTTYSLLGQYQYTIWASDTTGNWTQSSILQFEVINSEPVLSLDSVNPVTGFVDTMFNFTVTYTDLDNNAPGAITVNITNYGIIDLVEV